MRLSASLLLLAAIIPAEAAPLRAYYRDAQAKWRPLAVTEDARRGVFTFTLDPAKLPEGRTSIIQDPGRAVDMNDSLPPRLTGLKLGGRALATTSEARDLDWLPEYPAHLIGALRDDHNALDLANATLTVNGRLLPAAQLCFHPLDPRQRSARLVVALGALLRQQNRVDNTLELRVPDVSPERNWLTRQWRFQCLEKVTGDPMVLVDSCYGGYEKVDVLVDGKLMTPGETTVGVTWASREEAGDHWVVLAWPKERKLDRVRVHWAYYQATYWASQRLVVQTWDGQRWSDGWRSDANPTQPFTDVPLGGVTTSRLRLLQPDGGGNAAKGPNIFWLTEIELDPATGG